MRSCVQNRLQDPVGMNRPVVVDIEDPRRVYKTLASVRPASTASLVAEKSPDQFRNRLCVTLLPRSCIVC